MDTNSIRVRVNDFIFFYIMIEMQVIERVTAVVCTVYALTILALSSLIL